MTSSAGASSTTTCRRRRSGAETTVRRKYPGPHQVDQKASESASPTSPTIIRITPTAFTSSPETLASTAQVRIAPAAIKIRLTPIPMSLPSQPPKRLWLPSVLVSFVPPPVAVTVWPERDRDEEVLTPCHARTRHVRLRNDGVLGAVAGYTLDVGEETDATQLLAGIVDFLAANVRNHDRRRGRYRPRAREFTARRSGR